MPTRPRALLGLLTACLMAAFVALGTASPALACCDKYEGHKDGSSAAGLSGTTPPTTHAPSSNTGSSHGGGGGGYDGGGGGSTPPIFDNPDTGPGTGACNADRYPGGYSDTLAVPAPCAPVEECGRYLGSTFVHEACTPEDIKAVPAAPVITTEMVTEAARVVAPVNPPHVEPGNRSYVNIPNNYWADAPTVNTSITLLGQRIPLRWTPTGTSWSFGDGATATGNGIEGADLGAPGALEHSYSRQGSYDITTTTNYDLTFVLPGGGAQTIQLESPPSPPVTLPVSEIQTRVDYVR